MALLDVFTEPSTLLTAHTSDSGHTWAQHPVLTAVLTISASGTVRSNTVNATGWVYSSWVPASADYDVTVVPDTKTLAPQTYIGGVGRMDIGDDNGIEILWQSDNDRWEVREVINGTATTKITFAQTDPDGVAAKIELRGANVELFVAGVSRGSFTTTVTSAGRVGVVSYMGGTSVADTDHVHLDSIAAADPVPLKAPSRTQPGRVTRQRLFAQDAAGVITRDAFFGTGPTTTHQTVSWQSSYVVKGHQTASWQSSYVVKGHQTTSWQSSYTTKTKQTTSWVSSYTVKAHQQVTWQSSYTTKDHVTTSWVSSYTTKAHQSVAWSSSYTVKGHVTSTWVSSYSVVGLAHTTTSWSSSFTTRAHLATSWSSSYTTKTKATSTWLSSWTTKGHVTTQWSSGYSTGSHLLQTWGSSWVVKQRTSSSWATSYTVRQTVQVLWVSVYDVHGHIATSWSSRYAIITTVPRYAEFTLFVRDDFVTKLNLSEDTSILTTRHVVEDLEVEQ